MKLELTLINNSQSAMPRVFLERWVASLARTAAKELNAKRYTKLYLGRELVIVFVARAESRRLNRKFRAQDHATDVLSFSGLDRNSLGELVICPEVIARQAKEHGLLVREELGYMVIHGFLHLLGFDHEQSVHRARKMFAIQDRIFERLLRLVPHQPN